MNILSAQSFSVEAFINEVLIIIIVIPLIIKLLRNKVS